MTMLMAAPSKALLIKFNLVFLAFFLIYAVLLLQPLSSSYRDTAAAIVPCSLRECHAHKDTGYKMKAVLEETKPEMSNRTLTRRKKPSFLNQMGRGMTIGLLNMDDEDVTEWAARGKTVPVRFQLVSHYFEWKHLFPEWIDEEEEIDGPACPEIPMPNFDEYEEMDVLVAKLPCRYPAEGWGRDVFRLQVHLAAANLAARKGRRDWRQRTMVVLLSPCRPLLEVFRCDDLVAREGDWWFFRPEAARLEQKVSLPVGSCELALPLWGPGVDQTYDASKIQSDSPTRSRTPTGGRREAYATVLHSSESYVCGAIALGQSLLQTGTTRDLVMLVDASISEDKRAALSASGWKIRLIKRIRNPRAEKNTYNEYNYSKFRLWQLTDYDKIVFIDADIIVLKNLDVLFRYPQMTAAGNDGSIFNSGVMVIEPSKCTFRALMGLRKDVVSYNGGDQGFLNEVFVWWHRLPRRVNFLKNFWSNSSVEAGLKNQLFGADPPKLYAIHYLGLKPWLCYRDYDCNWDVWDQRVYASDVAHSRWWRVHDSMHPGLQKLCALAPRRNFELNWDRNKAKEAGLPGDHWKINVTDPRRLVGF